MGNSAQGLRTGHVTQAGRDDQGDRLTKESAASAAIQRGRLPQPRFAVGRDAPPSRPGPRLRSGRDGAPLWAARARAELDRISGRSPGPAALTATERRVAELVASGRSNKEAAAELFVTVRAIESTLTKVYAKLGVGSRTELAALLRDRAR